MTPAGDTLTQDQLNRALLARQQLLERSSRSVAQIAHLVGGLQSQQPRVAHIGLWSRVDGFESKKLAKALADRKVVRATLMRGTLFILAADDFVSFRPTIQPVLSAASPSAGVDPKLDPKKVFPAAGRLLKKEPRTFNELRAELSEKFPNVKERALGFQVRMNVPLVMEPDDSRWLFPSDARFALAEEWIGAKLGKGGSLGDFAKFYLAAFGPATPADFSAWSGLKGAKEVFADIESDLRRFKTEAGSEVFDLPKAPRPDADTPAPARFLPEWDCAPSSHVDRARILPEQYKLGNPKNNTLVRACFLSNGYVRGVWRVDRKDGKSVLSIAPFEKLAKSAIDELKQEAARLLAFTEGPSASVDIKVEKPNPR